MLLTTQSMADVDVTCLSGPDQMHLANFAEQCVIDKTNLIECKSAYNKCVERDSTPLGFWQTSTGVILISVISLLGGVSLGVQLGK